MENKEYEKMLELIDRQIAILVGVLCKRIEVLEKEKLVNLPKKEKTAEESYNKASKIYTRLFKSLTKEHIYEEVRALKALLRVEFKIGKLVFKSKPKEE